MAVVVHVFLCALEDRRNRDFLFVALVVSSFRAGFWFLTGGLTKLVTDLEHRRKLL